MHIHTHTHDSPAQTEGRLIRWASFYDGLVNLMTLGHARRLRTMTVDQALLKPGETVLDVGCGTGGVTPSRQNTGWTKWKRGRHRPRARNDHRCTSKGEAVGA